MHNILIAGVGGQGVVMMTNILSHAAFEENYDVKSNDVIGLSQRGGMVWGSVRYGSKVSSPNIATGECDVLLSLEPMEAARFAHMLKKDGVIIYNNMQIFSTDVQQEKSPYPDEGVNALQHRWSTFALEGSNAAKELGKIQVLSIIMLGALSTQLNLKDSSWLAAIRKTVKKDLQEINFAAFAKGRELMSHRPSV